MLLIDGIYKLVWCIALDFKAFSRKNTLAFLGLFVSFKENTMFLINSGPYSRLLIFFVACNKLGCYITLERFVRYKHSFLVGPIVSYEENEVL